MSRTRVALTAALAGLLAIGTALSVALPAQAVVGPTPPPGGDPTESMIRSADPGPADAAAIGPAPPAEWWRPGNIVDDWQFFDGGAMTQAQIQSFLESKGSLLAGRTWTVRGYSADDGKGSLGNVYCTAIPAGTSVPTSQVIAEIAVACNISPKAILATLEKESSVVTGSLYYIDTAMGYACPDSAGCDATYYGFVNQVYWAARQFQVYRQRPDQFNYRAGGTYTIPWAPYCPYNAAASPVYIENAATAALYNYTPYQPVAEVITGGSSPIAGCSAYGNYNFWRFWWNWFGDPHGGSPSYIKAIYQDLLGRQPEASGLTFWNRQLEDTGDYTAVVNAVLYSVESRTTRVKAAYSTVLRRDGEQEGVDYWVSRTAQGDIPIDNLAETLMSSDEYYTTISGGTDAGYVTQLYQDLLGRAPSDRDIAYWTSQLQQVGRFGVVWSIFNSGESLNRRIDRLYQELFGRAADANGLAFWAPILLASDDNSLRLALVQSSEYRTRATERFPNNY